MQIAGHSCQDGLACPTRIRSNLESHFNTLWDNQRKGSSKLTYCKYNQVKKSSSIIYEDFLDLADCRDRQCLMRLRSSSHRLNCETARYVTQKEIAKSNSTVWWLKRCEFCTTEEVHLLAHLPFANIIEEDEHYVLITCPRYQVHRTNLPRKYQITIAQKRRTPWVIHMAECDEIWPLCEKDIRCKIPEERKAETEELNPQAY